MQTKQVDKFADVKRIRANIYTAGYDCSNGGVSSWAHHVMVCDHPDIELLRELQKVTGMDPVLRVVRRQLRDSKGGSYEYVHLEPVIGQLRPSGFMYGGCHVYSSDSRFSELTGVQYPVKLHDRQE